MLKFKGSDLRAVLLEARTHQCRIVLAKDQGVYLLSEFGEKVADGPRKHLAYAVGCNPEVDAFDDWWSRARAELGGDDFAEYFDPQDAVLAKAWETGGDLVLEATETHITLAVENTPSKKR
jgi:hypothetical protein